MKKEEEERYGGDGLRGRECEALPSTAAGRARGSAGGVAPPAMEVRGTCFIQIIEQGVINSSVVIR